MHKCKCNVNITIISHGLIRKLKYYGGRSTRHLRVGIKSFIKSLKATLKKLLKRQKEIISVC